MKETSACLVGRCFYCLHNSSTKYSNESLYSEKYSRTEVPIFKSYRISPLLDTVKQENVLLRGKKKIIVIRGIAFKFKLTPQKLKFRCNKVLFHNVTDVQRVNLRDYLNNVIFTCYRLYIPP